MSPLPTSPDVEVSPAGVARPAVAAARRVVIKLGTRVLTRDNGRLALSRLYRVVEVAAGLVEAGRQVLLVSSGAVGLGKDALGLQSVPHDLEIRQACAAVGQGLLMQLYREGFGRLGRTCGQVLLTEGDFDDRTCYLNLRNTLMTLLRFGVVPVINENDAVSTEELALWDGPRRPVFGDNDRLSALVAAKLHADLLVLLTDVDGVFDKDPRHHPDARLVSRVDDPEALYPVAGGAGSSASRGGMRSKVEAAALAVRAGCHAVVASGLAVGGLEQVIAGDEVGSWFPARVGLPAKQRWIAFATKPRGVLVLDAGAVVALRNRGTSLLAAGVDHVEGDFQRGNVVELRDANRRRIGRGMITCGAATARLWCRSRREEGDEPQVLIRREHLVLDG